MRWVSGSLLFFSLASLNSVSASPIPSYGTLEPRDQLLRKGRPPSWDKSTETAYMYTSHGESEADRKDGTMAAKTVGYYLSYCNEIR